ncbi:MAG: hypothetical protein WB660_25685 [Candidatus Sulfotelmatobacter sp.]
MQHAYYRLPTLLLFLTDAFPGQSGPQDFATFFAKFKIGVAKQDQGAMRPLMAPHFAFIQAQDVAL